MSLFWTESFIAFERYNDLAADTTKTDSLIAAMNVAGYEAASRDATRGLFYVSNDPVMPERAALRFLGSVANTTSGSVAGVKLNLPSVDKPIVFGFSLYIPDTFVPSPTVTNGVLRVAAYASGVTDWLPQTNNELARDEVFQVAADLGIRLYTNAPQSTVKPAVGRMSYFEVRFDGAEVRVWMNDILVHQSIFGVMPASIAFTIQHSVNVSASGWCIGNIYGLIEDDTYPNVRLGPTTRVVGRRPSADVLAQFNRPATASSNAEVVAQNLQALPEQTLQTEGVGATDIYSLAANSSIGAASIVHAVATKVTAANLESTPHTMLPIIRSDETESEDGDFESFHFIPSFTSNHLTCIHGRPGGGLIAGDSQGNLWLSTDDGDTWAQVLVGAGAAIVGGGFTEDGNGLFITATSSYHYCAAGSPLTTWATDSWGTSVVNAAEYVGNNIFLSVASAAGGRRRITYPLGGSPTVATHAAAGSDGMVGHGGTILTFANVASTSVTYDYVYYSTDGGSSWTQVQIQGKPTGSSNTMRGDRPFVATYGDGKFVVFKSMNGGIYFSSSEDGIAWANYSRLGANPSGSGYLGSLGVIGGEFVLTLKGLPFLGMTGSSNAPLIAKSTDAFNWTLLHLPQFITTTQSGGVLGFTPTASGLLLGGDNGALIRYAVESAEKSLLPLAGYRTLYHATSKDPATGQQWQATAADVSETGMRVTS